MLELYKKKRKFKETPEPGGVESLHFGRDDKIKKNKVLSFVVQKHDARHLHYDLRLEKNGVLVSWAVPKGPPMDSSDKRLAIHVEDHPLEYGKFEGKIPEGNYGAGTVEIWDKGTYIPKEINKDFWEFELIGKKLKGMFTLIHTPKRKKNEWLMIKNKEDAGKIPRNVRLMTKKKKNLLNNDGGGSLHFGRDDSDRDKVSSKPNKDNKDEKFVGDTEKHIMPKNVKPMMATLVKESFSEKDWFFEIKWDGYRAIAEIEKNNVKLYSRNQLSFNDRFPEIIEPLEKINHDIVLDGEIVVLDKHGKPSFQLMQDYRRNKQGEIVYYSFDILYIDGKDVQGLPLEERKKILKKILPKKGKIVYSEHVAGEGKKFFSEAKKQGLEGVVAKKADSKYKQGTRSRDWLKIKTHHRQEAVIGGFTEGKGGRQRFGALVLGVYKNDDFIYVGHTGTGFDERALEEVYKEMKPLISAKSPFKNKPNTNAPVTWTKPELVAEISFAEWTKDGLMRQPVFVGLRDDKRVKEIKREIPHEKYKK